MDEMQVTAINALRERSVITAETRLIPSHYETFIELGFTNFNYYGYTVLALEHDWPHYANVRNGWLPTAFRSLSERHCISAIDFRRPMTGHVDATLAIKAESDGLINAVRVTARAHLVEGEMLGATNALNGDKVLPIDETHLTAGQRVQAKVSYRMGGGLVSLQVKLLHE